MVVEVRIDKYSLKCVLAALILFLISAPSYSQRSGEFIFAKVTTKSNEQYEGFVRWGKEELAWHDVFNSVNLNLSYFNHFLFLIYHLNIHL